jgi:hypothetical protein
VRVVSGGGQGRVPYATRGGAPGTRFSGTIVSVLFLACGGLSLFDLYVLLSGAH